MKLLKEYRSKYIYSSKSEKSKILDQYMSLCHIPNRNTVIKRFERFRSGKIGKKEFVKKPGRPSKYSSIDIELIRSVYHLSGFICAERLHPVLGLYISQLIDNDINFKIKYPNDTIEKVLNIPLGSLKSIILTFDKPKKKRFHLSRTENYRNIPVITDSYRRYLQDITWVGCDFVEHKGQNRSGPYAVTFTNVHFYSQWISRISALGKDRQAISKIYSKLMEINPLYRFNIIRKSHQDNEKALLSYLYYKQNMELSRSRSCHSNDNCLVEQKNGDKVRNIVGYFRYDTDYEVSLLNKIWEISDLIDNFFVPSHKIISGIKNDKGKIIKKVYDTPKTPYQILIECPNMKDEIKKELNDIFNLLNLIELRKKQTELLDELFGLKKDKKVLSILCEIELVWRTII